MHHPALLRSAASLGRSDAGGWAAERRPTSAAAAAGAPPCPPAQGGAPIRACPSTAVCATPPEGAPPPAPPGVHSRRAALGLPAATLASLAAAQAASASKLPEAADRAWESVGGGPADLTYPPAFLGVWDVASVLVSVDLPLGPSFVGDMAVVARAEAEDKGKVVRYQCAFVRNARGQVVTDRRFNTAALMATYLGLEAGAVAAGIRWDLDDPNLLQMGLPGGLSITTRVTRRSEEPGDGERLATSEFFQQLIESPTRPQPRVKASQAFTKYHWRSADAAAAADGGPAVVATQVVSDYVSGEDPLLMMRAKGRPVTVYTYRMSFSRPPPAATTA